MNVESGGSNIGLDSSDMEMAIVVTAGDAVI